MTRLLGYAALGILLVAGAWGGYRIWLEGQTKVAVSGTYKLCGLVEIYRKERGELPPDRSDIVSLLEKEKSLHNSAPYLASGDPFFSQEGHIVEYRREGTGIFTIVLRTRSDGMQKRIPSVQCKNAIEGGGPEFRPGCSCEIAQARD